MNSKFKMNHTKSVYLLVFISWRFQFMPWFCLFGGKSQMLVNSQPRRIILFRRELRQGGPLSPPLCHSS